MAPYRVGRSGHAGQGMTARRGAPAALAAPVRNARRAGWRRPARAVFGGVRAVLVAGAVAALAARAAELTLRPLGDTAALEFAHPDLAGQVFRLRLPEYTDVYTPLAADKVVWKREEKGWSFSWEQSDAVKQQCHVDFRGTVTAAGEALRVTFILRAVRASGARYWPFDIICGSAPQFHDPQGQRTYFRHPERFVSVLDLENGRLGDTPVGSFYFAPEPARPLAREYSSRWVAKTAQEGGWVLALGSDVCNASSYNLLPETSCIHQNFQWESLSPGAEQIVHLWVHLCKGTLDDAWRLHRQDLLSLAADAPDDNRDLVLAPPPEEAYLPTVWARPTPPRYLAKLSARRAPFTAAPLAAWVADTQARLSPGTATAAAAEAAAAEFATRDSFQVRDDDSGLWLSNGRIGVAFAPAPRGRGIISVYDLESRVEFLTAPVLPDAPPWRLQVLRQGDPPGVLGFFPSLSGPRPADLVSVAGRGVVPVHRLVTSAERLRLELTWAGVGAEALQGQAEVTVVLEMDQGSALSRWRIQAAADYAQAGLAEVQFPVVPALGRNGQNDLAKAWGCGLGQLFRQNTQVHRGVYPCSQWSLPLLALGFGDVALYLACHDPQANTKSFHLDPGVEFHFAAFPEDTGYCQRYAMPYDVVLGPVRGDWFEVAQTYRTWALRQPWCRQGPLADRPRSRRRMVENDLWVKPNYPFATSVLNALRMPIPHAEDEVFRNLTAFGADVPMGLWWYSWYQERFDEGDPVFTPYPDMVAVFGRERKAGFLVTPYVLAEEWDVSASGFREDAACKFIDGSLYTRSWTRCRTAGMCPATAAVRDTYAGLARQVAAHGATSLYLDGYAGNIYDCYDRSHGHPAGIGGHWWADASREVLARIHRDRGGAFGVIGEYWCEPYLDLYDVQHTTSVGWIEPEEVPLLPAVYGGYVATMAAPTHGHFPDDLLAFRLKMGRSVLWGRQIGGGMFSEYLADEQKTEFMRRSLRVRGRSRPWLVYGQMLRPPAIRTPVPRLPMRQFVMHGTARPLFAYDAVEASAWRSAQGDTAVFLVNYDTREQRVVLARPDGLARCAAFDSAGMPVTITATAQEIELTVAPGDYAMLSSVRHLPAVPACGPAREQDPGLALFTDTLGLAGRSDATAVRLLRQRTGHRDGEVRRAACYALGRASEAAPAAVPALTERLRDRDLSVQFAAAWALGQLGAAARSATTDLRALAGSANRRLVWVALLALGRVASPEPATLSFVDGFLSDPREEAVVAAHAALALLATESERHIQALIERHQKGNADFQLCSVCTLGCLGEQASPAIPALLQTLGAHGWWEVRRDAAWALGSIAPARLEVRHALQNSAANDANLEVRETAREALQRDAAPATAVPSTSTGRQ